MTAERSHEVDYAVECGALGLGPFAIRIVTHKECEILLVRAGKRIIETYVFPAGRSVRVFVDGKEATT